MTAKYDIKRLHADCLKWCEKPVFPYPWQHTYKLKRNFNDFLIISLTDDRLAILDPRQGEQVWETVCEFAHLIGLDVESYRIKETYKSAVERYLSTIGEGQPLWEGSGLLKKTTLYAPPVIYASLDSTAPRRVMLISDKWTDDKDCDGDWSVTYYLLRLDQNPDYQVEG